MLRAILNFFGFDGSGGVEYVRLPGDVSLAEALDAYSLRFDSVSRSCVDRISDQIAVLKLRAVDATTREVIPADARNKPGAFNYLMTHKIDGFTSFEWLRRFVSDVHWHGNAYAWIRVIDSLRFDLQMMDPSAVTPRRVDGSRAIEYDVRDLGVLPESEVIHIRYGVGTNRALLGAPPIKSTDKILDSSRAAYRRLYANLQFGVPKTTAMLSKSFVRTPTMGDEKKPPTQADYVREFAKQNPGVPIYFPFTGTEFKDFGHPATTQDEKLAFDILRETIADAYKVPIELLNYRAQERGHADTLMRFRQSALLPVMHNIERVLATALLPARYDVRFDDKGLLRGDPRTRVERAKVMLGPNGAAGTINDARDELDLDPIEGGDVRETFQPSVMPREE